MRYFIQLSTCALAMESDPFRLPPRAAAIRGTDYEDNFDFTTIFCDVFWDETGETVILLGPPLLNLLADLAPRVRALPSQTEVALTITRRYRVDETRITVPQGTTGLEIQCSTVQFTIPVQPSLCHLFAGRRALVTLSQDNEVHWISDWIAFYRRAHGCDAVLIYDNASRKYTSGGLARKLQTENPGIPIVVLDWPFPYGVFDGRAALTFNIFDSIYCQAIMLEHARHRFLASAAGVINVDIDELAVATGGRSIYDMVHQSEHGYLNFGGWWIVNHPAGRDASRRHGDYVHRKTGLPDSSYPKWAVVPRRCTERQQWLVHSISGFQPDALSSDIKMRHFKPINTNWDQDVYLAAGLRTATADFDSHSIVVDEALQQAMASAFAADASAPRPAETRTREMQALSLRVESAAAARAKDDRRAETLVRQAISLTPEVPGFHLFLGDLQDRNGDNAGALASQAAANAFRDPQAVYHYQLGRAAFGQGNDAAAIDHLRRAIDIDPHLAEAQLELFYVYRHLEKSKEAEALCLAYSELADASLFAQQTAGRMCVDLGKSDRAVRHARAAVAKGDDWMSFALLAAALRGARDLPQAIAAARTALERATAAPFIRPLPLLLDGQRFSESIYLMPDALLTNLAGMLLDSGDRDGAEEAARRAIACHPTSFSPHLVLAGALAAKGDAKAARDMREASLRWLIEQVNNEGVSQQPRRHYTISLCNGWLEQARQLHALGRNDEALAVARQLAASGLAGPAALLSLAEVLLRLNAIADCRACLAQLRTLQVESWRLEWIEAQLHLLSGDKRRAVELCHKAIALNPGDIALRKNLGNICIEAGAWQEAIEVYRTLLAQHPEDGETHFLLSMALHRSGDSQAALEPARRAAEIDPRDIGWNSHYGALLNLLGDWPQSIAANSHVLEIDPQNGFANYFMSRAHHALGQTQDAVAHAARAASLLPDNNDCRLHYSALLVGNGRWAEAIPLLASATASNPGSPDAHILMSHALNKKGDIDGALAEAEVALKLAPARPGWDAHAAALRALVKARA